MLATTTLNNVGEGGVAGDAEGVPENMRRYVWYFKADAFQRKFGAILFGGEGLILQRFWGDGTVFIHAPGDLIEYELRAGQTLKVSSGHAVGWEGSVAYDIQTVGGIKTAFFGGEGLFVTTLTGPGKVLLQSMTLGKLATALVPFLPQQTSGGASFTLRR